MKKILIVLFVFILVLIVASCQKNSPTAPAATATPANVEGTVVAVLTNVAIANATNTKIAQETETAAAGLYTATLTSTITPSPNQTATAAAIGTMISDIHASETEAVILSRTPTTTITLTITQTWTITDTYTATSTATVTPTFTSTPTSIPYSDIVSVPGGTYTQSDGTSSFSHTISTFKMGKYQVTYDLWNAVYQWAIANGYSFANAGAGSGYTPVTTVNWRDVIVWCNAYSQEAGLTPCYTYASAVIKDSTSATACDNAACAWTNNGYRLPSEGEYQYAASYINGSSWTPYNYASGATADYTNAAATGLVAWYGANFSSAQAVGGKTANALGIYDMSGNVWEWCWDWYGTYPGTSTDYRGPASGSLRVVRGGGFGVGAGGMQVGYRNSLSPYVTSYSYGFRFARTN